MMSAAIRASCSTTTGSATSSTNRGSGRSGRDDSPVCDAPNPHDGRVRAARVSKRVDGSILANQEREVDVSACYWSTGAARPETLRNSFWESRVVVLTGIGELHVPEHNHNVAASSQTQHLVFRVRHFPKRRRLGYGMLRGGVCCRSVCAPVSWRVDSRHVLNRNIAVCLDHETSISDRLR